MAPNTQTPPSTAPEIDEFKDGMGLAAAINQAGQAIIVTDCDGSILYVNVAFEKMTGYSALEVLGRNPRLLKSGKQDSAHYRRLWKALKEGRTWHGELVNRRKDGSLYTVSFPQGCMKSARHSW
jgi:PAS domain S-box-containing protein